MLVADPKQRISLSQLRDHPWLRGAASAVAAASSSAVATDSAQSLSLPLTLPLPLTAVAAEDLDCDAEDLDFDEVAGGAAGGLNAFDLVTECGGFCLERMFTPYTFCSKPRDSSEISGNMLFGLSEARKKKRVFSSPLVPSPSLMRAVFAAMRLLEWQVASDEEQCVVSGSLKASKSTSKGTVGIFIRVFGLCSTLSLLEVRRGKGDLLEWTSCFDTLVAALTPVLNVVAEDGEAKEN